MSIASKVIAGVCSDIDTLRRSELFLGKPENEKAMLSTVPLGRASKPSDVANACCYLASDEAEYVTGVDIPVCGGRCV